MKKLKIRPEEMKKLRLTDKEKNEITKISEKRSKKRNHLPIKIEKKLLTLDKIIEKIVNLRLHLYAFICCIYILKVNIVTHVML